jgi:LysM repeat protein
MTGMIGWLLLGMALFPTLGAIAARLIARRADGAWPRVVGSLGFGGAVVCAIVLSRASVDPHRMGRLAIFLPSNDVRIARESFLGPLDVPESLAAAAPDPTTTPAIVTAAPTATPSRTPTVASSPTMAPTATIVPTATPAPTATIAPTATPEPTAMPAPTTPPPQPTAPAAQPQRYVVEAGDTLRAISERFGVSVTRLLDYNGLTPEEGDNLRIGQVLYVPPR